MLTQYLVDSTAAADRSEGSIVNCLSSLPPHFRDRALFASLAVLHGHGGQFPDGGRAALDAGDSRSVP